MSSAVMVEAKGRTKPMACNHCTNLISHHCEMARIVFLHPKRGLEDSIDAQSPSLLPSRLCLAHHTSMSQTGAPAEVREVPSALDEMALVGLSKNVIAVQLFCGRRLLNIEAPRIRANLGGA